MFVLNDSIPGSYIYRVQYDVYDSIIADTNNYIFRSMTMY